VVLKAHYEQAGASECFDLLGGAVPYTDINRRAKRLGLKMTPAAERKNKATCAKRRGRSISKEQEKPLYARKPDKFTELQWLAGCCQWNPYRLRDERECYE